MLLASSINNKVLTGSYQAKTHGTRLAARPPLFSETEFGLVISASCCKGQKWNCHWAGFHATPRIRSEAEYQGLWLEETNFAQGDRSLSQRRLSN